jgi:hypothetical protein
VTDPTHGQVVRVDPVSDSASGAVAMPGASAIAVLGDVVYVIDPTDGVVAAVDAGSGQVLKTFRAIAPDFAATDELVASGTRLWAISTARGTVRQLDAGLQQIGTRVQLPGIVTTAVSAASGALWLAFTGSPIGLGLLRPGAGRVAPVPSARRFRATALAVTRAGLWSLDPTSSTLTLLEAK